MKQKVVPILKIIISSILLVISVCYLALYINTAHTLNSLSASGEYSQYVFLNAYVPVIASSLFIVIFLITTAYFILSVVLKPVKEEIK
ncbi:MAG: hypothetical protein LBV51_00340 [Acholeplasmatales bacterium]|jgi:hypothetical protein|nr:hypothetical protein [Acholeplasmatales bacterium]